MITPNNAKQAVHVADNANYNDHRLTPMAGSPMSALVCSIQGFNEKGHMDEICALSESANTSNGTHGEIEAEIAAKSANIISGIVNTARNVVNPRCKEVLEAIDAYKQQQAEGKVGTVPNVRQVDMADVFKDEMFSEMINTYKDSNVVYDKDHLRDAFNLLQETITADECSELVKTGSSRLDGKIMEYLGSSYQEALDIAWREYEGIGEMTLKDLTLMFFIVNGVCNGRIEKMDGIISDTFLNAALVQYKALVARRLCKVVKRLSDAIAAGDLILPVGIEKFDPEYEIVVVGEVYRNWLQEGVKGAEGEANVLGSPEAVMGFAIDSKNAGVTTIVNTSDLMSNPAKYAEIFAKQQRHCETMRSAEELKDTPRILGEYLASTIHKSDIEDDEKIKLQQRLGMAIQIPYHTTTTVTDYVRDVVCAVYTEGDDVKRVLVNIDEALAGDECNDLDYAVYVAICKLIGCWIARQIECKATVAAPLGEVTPSPYDSVTAGM